MTQTQKNTGLTKAQRCTLLKIKSEKKSFQDITDEIMEQKYRESLNSENEVQFDENDNETFFLSKWENNGKIETLDMKSRTINFRKAIAVCEYSKRKFRDDKNNLLPKAERMNIQTTDVLFVEYSSEVYVIIYSSDAYDIKRVKRIIKHFDFEPLGWNYEINDDLFTWLFYRYINKKNRIGSDICIKNITGFTGNMFSNENKVKEDSETTADLSITKTFIASKHNITSLKIEVTSSAAITSFHITSTSSCELKIRINRDSEPDLLFCPYDTDEIMSIYVYFYLIPEISEAYEKRKKDFEKKYKEQFLFDLGLDVIRRIMDVNGISKNQI